MIGFAKKLAIGMGITTIILTMLLITFTVTMFFLFSVGILNWLFS